MTTADPTDRRFDTSLQQRHSIADHYVGHKIMINRSDGWNAGRWATIKMVVPSRNKLCWLVEYPNGDTDVVRIFGNSHRYVLADQTCDIETPKERTTR